MREAQSETFMIQYYTKSINRAHNELGVISERDLINLIIVLWRSQG